MIRLPALIMTCLACGLLSACDTTSTVVSCNLQAEEHLVTSSEAPFEVQYQVEGSGDGAISRIVYLDSQGIIRTKTDIKLPWSITVVIPANEKASLSALGKLNDGHLEINITGSNGESNIKAVDQCSQKIKITSENTRNHSLI